MKKFLALLPCLILTASALAEPETIRSTFTITHGWTKNEDGSIRSLKGVVMPITITPISADRMTPKYANPIEFMYRRQRSTKAKLERSGFKGGQAGGGDLFLTDTQVYNSNFGNYGMLDPGEFINPSSLDDLTLSGAAPGKLWTVLGFGFQTDLPTGTPFQVRFRCYDTKVENAPGTSDYVNEFSDFGGTLGLVPTFAPGGYYIQIDPSLAAVVAPNTTMFMGVQFRVPDQFGEGAFLPDLHCIYNNTTNPPSIGTSEDSFIFDNDPLDGIYENSEIDAFDGTRGDLALDISVDSNSSSLTLLPSNAVTVVGQNVAGNFVSLLFEGDNDIYEIFPSFAVPRNSPIANVIVEAFSPTATPLALSFDATTFATTGSMDSIVEFWNFSTNAWVKIDQRPITTAPLSYSVTYGGLVNLANFVRTTTPKIFRARISFINTSASIPRSFRLKADKFNWRVVY